MDECVKEKVNQLKKTINKYYKKYGKFTELTGFLIEFMSETSELFYATGYIKCYMDMNGIKNDKNRDTD